MAPASSWLPKMRFDILTLFPEYFSGMLGSSILKRAQAAGAIEIRVHDIRAYTTDKHHVCDDAPFGGGAGMVMKAEPLALALEDVLNFKVGREAPPCPVVLMTPQGRPFSQRLAEELSAQPRLCLICGHYEGIDERLTEAAVTDEISIGDYVLTGGEPAAAVVVDAVARLVPGVLGNEASARHDSFGNGLLEAPQYTRPAEWRGVPIPEILTSGHHAAVDRWRLKESLRRTAERRPDLIETARDGAEWTSEKEKIWQELQAELKGEDDAT